MNATDENKLHEDVAKIRELMSEYEQRVTIISKLLHQAQNESNKLQAQIQLGRSMVLQLPLFPSSAPGEDGASTTTGKEPSSP